MRILALETSTRLGTLAAAERSENGWRIASSIELSPDRRTAQTLAPAIAEMLDQLGWRQEGLDAVAATTGPGSFTGLRIGVTAAKTLAYATGAQAIGVNTLTVIARQWLAYPQCDHAPQTHVVMDAHRDEFFAATFEYPPTGDKAPPEVRLIDRQAWLDSLQPDNAVSGPGLSLVEDDLPEGLLIAPPEKRPPRADAVALLAGEMLDAGHGVEPWRLLPQYYRMSAAEEKAAMNE